MRQKYLIVIFLMLSALGLSQETDSVFLYRKGSIYSLMIGHRAQEYGKEIEEVFTTMPAPERYFDHNLGKNVFYTSEKKLKEIGLNEHMGFKVNDDSNPDEMNDLDIFCQKSYLASRLIAKWFNRKKATGTCNMDLVQERGYKNATEVEKRVAAHSVRKDALLKDAGEELIGSTFVLINDIRTIDRSRGSAVIGGIVSAASQTASIATGAPSTRKNLGDLIATYKGFNVKIKTYLYQLVWDEESASLFYNDIYSELPDEAKKTAFENNRGKFSLVYLGMQESSGKSVSFMGIKEDQPQIMVRKACQRALDENVANLQKTFDVFKIKAPLISTDPLACEIGMKEGVTEKSRFEVLEIIEDENGHIRYERVAEIRPVEGKIWDNRYMALEEKSDAASLKYTTFRKHSGGNIYPGMLIRELR